MNKDASESTSQELIGARVRRLRQQLGVSQDSLSIRANVDQSGLSKFERGGRGLGEVPLRRIAGALGISFEELIRGTDFASKEASDPAGS